MQDVFCCCRTRRSALPRIIMQRSALRKALYQQADDSCSGFMGSVARQGAWQQRAESISTVKISAAVHRVQQRGNSERVKAMRNAARRCGMRRGVFWRDTAGGSALRCWSGRRGTAAGERKTLDYLPKPSSHCCTSLAFGCPISLNRCRPFFHISSACAKFPRFLHTLPRLAY